MTTTDGGVADPPPLSVACPPRRGLKSAYAATLIVAVTVAVNAMTTFGGGLPQKIESQRGAAIGWVGFQAAYSLAVVAGAARIRSRARLDMAAALVGLHGALTFVGTAIALSTRASNYPAIVATGHAVHGAAVLFALGAFAYTIKSDSRSLRAVRN